MNAVMGILNYISDERNGELENELKIINKSFNQLLNLIDEILLLSKLHTEQVKINYQEISLKKMFQNVELEIRNKVSEFNKKIDIEFNFKEDIIVKQDPDLIFKLLQHVSDNAVKYTDSGKISLGYGIVNTKCFGYIKDTGIGIDEINIDSVFKEFQKIEFKDRIYDGLGIGLAIVKEISDLVDTPITLESEKNKGTTFKIEFVNYKLL